MIKTYQNLIKIRVLSNLFIQKSTIYCIYLDIYVIIILRDKFSFYTKNNSNIQSAVTHLFLCFRLDQLNSITSISQFVPCLNQAKEVK